VIGGQVTNGDPGPAGRFAKAPRDKDRRGPDDALRSRVGDKGALIRRFWGVVVAGYSAAILVVCAGVWLSAQPFLDRMQREATLDRAVASARLIEDQLEEALERYRAIVANPMVLNLVVGYERSPLRVIDHLAQLEGDNHVRYALLDYQGFPLVLSSGFELRKNRAAFSRAETLGTPAVRFADGAPVAQTVIRVRAEADARSHAILFAIPVIVKGLPEGTLVVERTMALTASTVADSALDNPHDWRIVTDFQRMQLQSWLDLAEAPLAAPIGETGLFLASLDHSAGVTTLGWELLRRVLQVVVWGLLLPFLGMAVFGRGVIMKPYEALAASRRKLAQSEEELSQLAQIAKMSHEAIIVQNLDARIIWANPAFLRLSRYSESEVLDRTPASLLHGPGTDPVTVKRIADRLNRFLPVREELLHYPRVGPPYWASISVTPLQSEDGSIDRYVAIFLDISDRKLAEERLEQARRETEYQAQHDSLTGLPNRRALDDLLETEIGADPTPRTLVRIDLDHFKAVNDSLGHAAGDHVLVHVSNILRNTIGPEDFAGRIGGDEFVIALGPGRDCKDGVRLAEALLKEIRRDILFDGKICRIGASFGVAGAGTGLIDNADLLAAADAALYEAKEQGRSQTVVYAPAIHAGVQDMRRLAVEIESGIAREEFVPLFQPQIDAQSQKIVGAEVLLRWQHPDQGLLAPGAFLQTAERLSMLTEIDRIIYRQGLRIAAELERVGHPLPKISFNVGAAQIEDPELFAISERHTLNRTRIAFEILESVLLEEQSSNFRFQVDRLREQGFRIEIDDFGSGHASVVGLMQLNPDAMKIDQRLITPITESTRTRDLVRHMVGIGRSFGISVTAEGVETAEHVKILTELGCNTLQGFHYAPALNVLDLLDFIETVGTQFPEDMPQRLPNDGGKSSF
jgi:diguanylate cyclase (GGDEF)-like protein/PAS domain S-box-containing protein